MGLARVAARSGAASGCHPPCEYLALAPIWKWSADNGCPHPASMRIVATTMNAAVKIVSGLRVTAFPDDATYLVVAEGGFVLQEAPDRGARPAPGRPMGLPDDQATPEPCLEPRAPGPLKPLPMSEPWAGCTHLPAPRTRPTRHRGSQVRFPAVPSIHAVIRPSRSAQTRDSSTMRRPGLKTYARCRCPERRAMPREFRLRWMSGFCHGRSPDAGLDDCVRGRPVPDDRRRVDGEAELSSQEFQDSLVDVGGALHHQEVPDTLDQLGPRSGAAVVRHPVHLLLGHAMAAVLGTVQV